MPVSILFVLVRLNPGVSAFLMNQPISNQTLGSLGWAVAFGPQSVALKAWDGHGLAKTGYVSLPPHIVGMFGAKRAKPMVLLFFGSIQRQTKNPNLA